jgi:cysteine-rich repeat protein
MKPECVGYVAAIAVSWACAPHSVDLGGQPAGGSAGSSGISGVTAATAGAAGAVSGAGGQAGTAVTGHTTCGDGIVEGDESCDDGNSVSGDGCDPTCAIEEPGFGCSPGLGCFPICGDGLVAGDERCDDGNRVNDDGCANDCGRVISPDCTEAPSPPPPPAEGDVKGPCDIYAEDGGPCVAAHSTVRALYAMYRGPLYEVRRSDGTTLDITPVSAGGFAESALQDAFCADSTCTISTIYDQSGYGNHLVKAPPGAQKPTPGNEADAAGVAATFGGHSVYGVHVVRGVGYRNNDACGTATGDDPETEYMVAGGNFYNAGCCFDYGNMERGSQNNGDGAVEAVYFGSNSIWGAGAGAGPWVMGDLENGLWAGDVSHYEKSASLHFAYVTAMVKGDAAGTNHWTIKVGDATAGKLTTPFDGARPSVRYSPMRKEGAIGMGTAGDNGNEGQGDFFEGVMTAHYSSNSADAAVQANIVSVYGGM